VRTTLKIGTILNRGIHMEKVCESSDIPKGTMKGFTVKDKQILIANVDGNFYAMDAVCSHMHGYLVSGTLEKNIVICQYIMHDLMLQAEK
jgi:nitrite reductase/ring-hydroxylating ferredoxin subunit